jgi:hypothetical protein
MDGFIKWVSDHAVALLLIGGTAYAILYIVTHRKSLFYKE